jgi:hypothetical protein
MPSRSQYSQLHGSHLESNLLTRFGSSATTSELNTSILSLELQRQNRRRHILRYLGSYFEDGFFHNILWIIQIYTYKAESVVFHTNRNRKHDLDPFRRTIFVENRDPVNCNDFLGTYIYVGTSLQCKFWTSNRPPRFLKTACNHGLTGNKRTQLPGQPPDQIWACWASEHQIWLSFAIWANFSHLGWTKIAVYEINFNYLDQIFNSYEKCLFMGVPIFDSFNLHMYID